MENYLTRIEEAIQRTPEEKKKVKAIQKDFEEAFGDRIYSKKFDYEVTVKDLETIFHIVNKWFFKNKLNIDTLEISTQTISEDFFGYPKEKGSFFLRLNENGKHKLIIYKRSNKDNLFQIVNVFLHELIHYYDCEHGEMKNHLSNLIIQNVNGKQYVDKYNAHGKFFKAWCDTINKFGFYVKEKYSIRDKSAMKKIAEKNSKVQDKNSFEYKISRLSDEEAYKRIKAIYDSLKNCEKDMGFKDSKNWFISIC